MAKFNVVDSKYRYNDVENVPNPLPELKETADEWSFITDGLSEDVTYTYVDVIKILEDDYAERPKMVRRGIRELVAAGILVVV